MTSLLALQRRTVHHLSGGFLFAGALAAALAAPTTADAVASALLRQNRPLPGGAPGQIVTGITNTAVNQVGGYAVGVNTNDARSHFWGNASGGAGAVLRTEGTFGSLVQTAFESFYGMGDGGELCYSATGTGGPVGGFDSVWLDGTPIAVEGDPVASIAGNFWVFGSRPGVTATGIPYWVGGVTTTQGGTTQRRGIFYGAAANIIVLGGQPVPGLPFVMQTGNSPFDYRFSALGTHNISPLLMTSGSTAHDDVMILDGAGLVANGSLVREQTPVPALSGGLPGENWDNFDFCGVTETGDYFFTGDTEPSTTTDEYICKNGVIIFREGNVVDGQTLSGDIEGAFMNENGDIAYIWDVAANTLEALFLNNDLLLKETDAVDLSGDGIVEPTSKLSAFTGISSLTVGPRDGSGNVDIYFVADVDTAGTTSTVDDIGGYFRLRTQVGPPVAVTLSDFEAESGDDGVRLRWRTSQEARHAGFHVERADAGEENWERRSVALVTGDLGRYEWLDAQAVPGASYAYRLAAVDEDGRIERMGRVEVVVAGRLATQLLPNSPNPFAGETNIRFRLANAGPVHLSVYDASGRVVRTLTQTQLQAGEHSLRWDGRDAAGRSVSAGVYLARLEVAGRTIARKMLLARP